MYYIKKTINKVLFNTKLEFVRGKISILDPRLYQNKIQITCYIFEFPLYLYSLEYINTYSEFVSDSGKTYVLHTIRVFQKYKRIYLFDLKNFI